MPLRVQPKARIARIRSANARDAHNSFIPRCILPGRKTTFVMKTLRILQRQLRCRVSDLTLGTFNRHLLYSTLIRPLIYRVRYA